MKNEKDEQTLSVRIGRTCDNSQVDTFLSKLVNVEIVCDQEHKLRDADRSSGLTPGCIQAGTYR